jgi:hypothetical protein
VTDLLPELDAAKRPSGGQLELRERGIQERN